MKITFLGAAQTVTGSCFVIETEKTCFAIDCGMHQGSKIVEKRNWNSEPYFRRKIDFILLTHAHIDHSGLLPRLVADGFNSPIYCTAPTADLLSVMLPDSAFVQESEAMYENKRRLRRGESELAEPLYTEEDALNTCKLLETNGVKFNSTFHPAVDVAVTYYDAGHILGAAFILLEIIENGKTTKVVFSGDLGRDYSDFLTDRVNPPKDVDYLFVESTYGNRDHKDNDSTQQELIEALRYCINNGGKMVIPAFAVERTQEILYAFYKLLINGVLPKNMPVFLDSPLAIKATEIFRKYPSFLDKDMQNIFAKGENPLNMPNLRMTSSKQESIAINGITEPAVIISASGMCNAGRIQHHLSNNLWNKNSVITFVGYQGVGTPGRAIVEGAKSIKIFGQDVSVNAKIATIGGFSGHAGQSELMNWMSVFKNSKTKVFLIHGEEKAQRDFSKLIEERLNLKVEIPVHGETIELVAGGVTSRITPVEKALQHSVISEELYAEISDFNYYVDLLRQDQDFFMRFTEPEKLEVHAILLLLNQKLRKLV